MEKLNIITKSENRIIKTTLRLNQSMQVKSEKASQNRTKMKIIQEVGTEIFNMCMTNVVKADIITN